MRARVAGHSLAGAVGSDPGKLLHLLTRIPGRRPILKLLLLGGVILIAGIPGLTWAEEPAVDVEYSRPTWSATRAALSADVYMPHDGAGPFPGMLVVHGGAWRMGSRADLAASPGIGRARLHGRCDQSIGSHRTTSSRRRLRLPGCRPLDALPRQ